MNNTKRILDSIRKNPTASNYKIAKNLSLRVAEVEKVRGVEVVEPEGGIPLTKLRVQSRKPAESAAKFIKRLPVGRGFCPKELSCQWGMSEDTIRRHARDLQCLKFVEVTEDEWKALVMHPTTAQKYEH